MSNDLTPWEEINPPMASAQRRGQLSEYSAQARTVFRNELTACLALTAPAGMTEESRGEWLAVAWDTLKDIPPDILTIGARKAREQCDHPSKVVPTIIAETADWLRLRRETHELTPAAPRLPAPERCTPEEARQILERYGLRSHFRTHREPNYPTKPVE